MRLLLRPPELPLKPPPLLLPPLRPLSRPEHQAKIPRRELSRAGHPRAYRRASGPSRSGLPTPRRVSMRAPYRQPSAKFARPPIRGCAFPVELGSRGRAVALLQQRWCALPDARPLQAAPSMTIPRGDTRCPPPGAPRGWARICRASEQRWLRKGQPPRQLPQGRQYSRPGPPDGRRPPRIRGQPGGDLDESPPSRGARQLSKNRRGMRRRRACWPPSCDHGYFPQARTGESGGSGGPTDLHSRRKWPRTK